MHPLLVWILALFSAAALVGIIGALRTNAELRWMLTGMRNWVALPLFVLVGYCLVLQPRQARRFCYVLVAGGIGASARHPPVLPLQGDEHEHRVTA